MESCLQKQENIKRFFSDCKDVEERYQKIIEFGRSLASLPSHEKIPENLIEGCQSQTYLHTCVEDGLIIFRADSDALISRGLAALLIEVYSGQPPEALFRRPPNYLEELGIPNSLTPGRTVGLLSLFKRMQQEAAKIIAQS